MHPLIIRPILVFSEKRPQIIPILNIVNSAHRRIWEFRSNPLDNVKWLVPHFKQQRVGSGWCDKELKSFPEVVIKEIDNCFTLDVCFHLGHVISKEASPRYKRLIVTTIFMK